MAEDTSNYTTYVNDMSDNMYDPYDITDQNQPVESLNVVEPEDSFMQQYPGLLTETEPEGVVIYEFIPEITDAGAYLYNTYDVSFNTLLYLHSLGYPYAQWNTSFYRGRIISDICDVFNGRFFKLDTLIDDARNHAAGGVTPGNWKPHNPYYPPAPIYAQTHPSCRCALSCLRPRDFHEIPDTAPGIPMTTSRKLITEAKKRLWEALSDEYINAHTFVDAEQAKQLSLITMPEELNQVSQERYRTREDFAPEAYKYQRNRHVRKWNPSYPQYAPPEPSEASDRSIKKYAQTLFVPIELTESFIYESPHKLLTPMAKGYRGFIVKRGEHSSRVYLVNLNYILDVPNDAFAELTLRVSSFNKNNTYGSMYVYVDDMLGIAFKVFGTKEQVNYALVYLPELNDIIETTNWRVMEVI